MHVHHIRTPGVASSSTEVSYKRPRTSSEGLTSEKTVFTMVVSLQREKRKLRNQVMSFVRTERLIKQSNKAMFDRKDDEWSVEVKGRYTCVKTQCTIYNAVQIFRLVKIIQRKSLCRENVAEIQL